jgi:hypothetical protein
MTPADSSDVVTTCLARVLGVDAALLRPDTPLIPLGWDSLARICLVDVLGEVGWECGSLATAATVGDVIDACPRTFSGRHM